MAQLLLPIDSKFAAPVRDNMARHAMEPSGDSLAHIKKQNAVHLPDEPLVA
jgi:hypothetical protein